MNFDMLKGKFNQILGDAKTEFGKLTDDELKMLEGQRDKFIGVVQEKYGIAKEEAENKFNEFKNQAETTAENIKEKVEDKIEELKS